MRNPEVTSRIMSSIKARNTRPENILGRAMWSLGLRYRKQYPIEGKPDFVFVSPRVVVFCDGDFWHGNNWKIRGMNSFEEELETYNDYWRKKISSNIQRDQFVTKFLNDHGWMVLRYWESSIKTEALAIAEEIYCIVRQRKPKI